MKNLLTLKLVALIQLLLKDTDLAGHRSDFNDYLDRVQNPSMYSTPRLIKFSLGMNF